jgi:3-phenylpropionate/trans-cinnamate dioxygenase ferredoxin reductase subunit
MTVPSSYGVLIVGAGHAAGELATALRQEGYTGSIGMIGQEPWLPYQRPPLSKAFLAGQVQAESLLLKPRQTYERAGIDLLLETEVTGLEREGKRVSLADGRKVGYESLALATGGRPRKLVAPGVAEAERCENFHYLRTIADVTRIRQQFEPGFRLVVIGGGYIGLEVAAVGVKHGLKVTVLEALPRVLARVTAPEVSAFYERVHREAGVDLRTGTRITGFELDPSGDAVAAVLTEQGRVAADLVIVGVGIQPNLELAARAGLDTADGVLVDEQMRSSDPAIVAIGDCANHPNVCAGCRLRLESVPNAVEQARVAAATLAGKPRRYEAVPWFWSDQYDLKLQMVGISKDYDQLVLRGDPGARSFMAFYLRGGRVIAADAVSRPAEFMLAKRLVGGGLTAPADRLADPAFPLKSLLES